MILILTDHGDVQKPCERRGLFSDLSERGSFSFISRYSSVLTSLAAKMSASLADSCRSVASIATPNATALLAAHLCVIVFRLGKDVRVKDAQRTSRFQAIVNQM
jgi:hypothetical protein